MFQDSPAASLAAAKVRPTCDKNPTKFSTKWSSFATLLATTHLCAPLPLFSTFYIRKKHPRHHHHHRKLRGRFSFQVPKSYLFCCLFFFSKRKIIDSGHHGLRVVGNRQDPRGPVGGVVCGGDLDGPHLLFYQIPLEDPGREPGPGDGDALVSYSPSCLWCFLSCYLLVVGQSSFGLIWCCGGRHGDDLHPSRSHVVQCSRVPQPELRA